MGGVNYVGAEVIPDFHFALNSDETCVIEGSGKVSFEIEDNDILNEMMDIIRKGKGFPPFYEDSGWADSIGRYYFHYVYVKLSADVPFKVSDKLIAVVCADRDYVEDDGQSYSIPLSPEEQYAFRNLAYDECERIFNHSFDDILAESYK